LYAYIKGIIKKIEPTYVIIENNDIGYVVIVPNPYKYKFDEERMIHTYNYVREDINNLYGFENFDAKNVFMKLIKVTGIGPKSALSILANDDLTGLVRSIKNGDAKFLTKFPGIGNKTAQQIILDLNGKLNETINFESTSNLSQATEALSALGYSKKEIDSVLKNLDNNLNIEEIIKIALKRILK